MEKKMENSGIIGVMLGLYRGYNHRDNGKENGSYYIRVGAWRSTSMRNLRISQADMDYCHEPAQDKPNSQG